MAVRHPLVVVAILFILVSASLALGPFLGLPRILGRYWGKEVYIIVFGGAFVYLTLSDRRRKKIIGHHVSADDTGALQRTQALSSQIDDKLRLDDFKWTSTDPRSTIKTGVRRMPSDQGVLKDNVLYLPGELKGRLEEDELDPLIGSSLIRHSDPRIRLKESAITGFVTVPLFLLIITIALIGPILEPGTIVSGVVTIVLVLSAFVIIFGGGYLFARTERSLVLESDRKAAGLIGKEPLLRTLKKLAEMDLPDQRRLKKRRNYLLANYDDSFRPSIDDRIRSLLKQH